LEFAGQGRTAVYVFRAKVGIVDNAEQDYTFGTEALRFARPFEAAMTKPQEAPEERACQGVSSVNEPCDLPAKRRCEHCGLWFCRMHHTDPDWHACAPDQGTG
jgi:hypothetical protein